MGAWGVVFGTGSCASSLLGQSSWRGGRGRGRTELCQQYGSYGKSVFWEGRSVNLSGNSVSQSTTWESDSKGVPLDIVAEGTLAWSPAPLAAGLGQSSSERRQHTLLPSPGARGTQLAWTAVCIPGAGRG